jgi:hypothetical protein
MPTTDELNVAKSEVEAELFKRLKDAVAGDNVESAARWASVYALLEGYGIGGAR